jgi:hypothetical protein
MSTQKPETVEGLLYEWFSFFSFALRTNLAGSAV